jgi:hypothetical protein
MLGFGAALWEEALNCANAEQPPNPYIACDKVSNLN